MSTTTTTTTTTTTAPGAPDLAPARTFGPGPAAHEIGMVDTRTPEEHRHSLALALVATCEFYTTPGPDRDKARARGVDVDAVEELEGKAWDLVHGGWWGPKSLRAAARKCPKVVRDVAAALAHHM